MAKTNAEKCKNYYNRRKAAKEAEKIRQGLSVKKPTRKTGAERSRAYRLRKKKLSQVNGSSVTEILSIPSSSNSRIRTFGPSFQLTSTSASTNRPDVSTVSSTGIADHDGDNLHDSFLSTATHDNRNSIIVQAEVHMANSPVLYNHCTSESTLLADMEQNRLLQAQETIQQLADAPNVHILSSQDIVHDQERDLLNQDTIMDEKLRPPDGQAIHSNSPEQFICNQILPCKNNFSTYPNMSTENITLELNECTSEITIKEEFDDEHHIKSEIEPQEDEENLPTDNPFQNIQLHIKEEISIEKDVDSPGQTIHDSTHDVENKIHLLSGNLDIKEENETITSDEVISYDYPNFDDSMDSNEAVALSNVEACLQDDGNIKNEMHGNVSPNFYKTIKDETDLTVTETHLISNKLINTTSTITNPRDGLIESQTTKTLVMEIRPMTETTIPLKLGNPEEILPTSEHSTNYDAFQLNSITGNVLSLEQQAYGLLQTKPKKNRKVKKYACLKCPNAYISNSQLQKHLRVHETIEKRAMGILKGVKTRTENRNKKLKLDEEDKEDDQPILKKEGYECTCGNVFRRRSRMETCLRSHNLFDETNSYPCMTCSRQFKSKEELAQHRKRVHRKRFPCKFCPTDYNTRKELFKHLQIHQKVQLMEYKVISEVVKSKQKLNCFMCSKSYNELSDLKSHVMDDHKEPYSCPNCKRTFPKIIDFGHHTKTYHPEVECQSVLDVLEAFSKLVQAWKCEECGLQFHEADKLALHQIETHSPELKADPQLQCEDCRRVFFTQKGLTSHRRIHHSTESVEETPPEEIGVMCLECRKMCKDITALTSHMRLHSPDRKYPCKFCDFRFATQEKRKSHAEIHTGVMKYVCFICEYQCSSENRLKLHKFSTKHLDMKEFLLTGPKVPDEQSPSVPKKEEKAVKKRKRERDRSESVSKDTQVPCDICGDMFPTESEMLEHKQTHPFIEFPNDDKPSRIFFK